MSEPGRQRFRGAAVQPGLRLRAVRAVVAGVQDGHQEQGALHVTRGHQAAARLDPGHADCHLHRRFLLPWRQ